MSLRIFFASQVVFLSSAVFACLWTQVIFISYCHIQCLWWCSPAHLQFTVLAAYCFCRYRKVVSNVCEGGVDLQQNLAQHMCPLIAPKGLQISIRGESLAVKPGEDITFIVRQEQVVMNIGFMKVSLLFLGFVSLLPALLLNEINLCLRQRWMTF